MNHTLTRVHPLLARAVILCTLTAANLIRGQSSDNAGDTPAARLEKLDSTYNSALRKYHAPIIQEYLVSLDKLKQSMIRRGRQENADAVQTEIDKVKKLSNGDGLLPYDVLKPARQEEAPAGEQNRFGPKSFGGMGSAPIILPASSARKTSRETAAMPEKSDIKAVPAGTCEWRIEKIPAGDYRVAVHGSFTGRTDGATLSARLGESTIKHDLTEEDVRGSGSFRSTRLGVIHLDKELSGEDFTLQYSAPDNGLMWVTRVILAKVSEDNARPAP